MTSNLTDHQNQSGTCAVSYVVLTALQVNLNYPLTGPGLAASLSSYREANMKLCYRQGEASMCEDNAKESVNGNCPFCGRNNCEHGLLVVDKLSQTAVGGALYEAFNNRLSLLAVDGDSDDEDGQVFETLLEEVDSLADAVTGWDYEGGPGGSTSYDAYFVSSAEKASFAFEQFNSWLLEDLISKNGSDELLRVMKRDVIAPIRKRYIEMAWPGRDIKVEPLQPEEEAKIPRGLLLHE